MPRIPPLPLIPRPSLVTAETGTFTLRPSTTLACTDPEFEDAAHWLRAAIGPATGFRLPSSDDGGISFVRETGLSAEGYRLTVRADAVVIGARDGAGALYGAQTLRQLLAPAVYRAGRVGRNEWTVPAFTIEDVPRFRWRGLDYQAFPRLCAFSETVWSGPERDFTDFGNRLTTHLERLDALSVEYRPRSGPLPWQTRPDRHGPAATR